MRRWLRQYDKSSCGPIALINLDKWLGKSVTKRDLTGYRWLCDCHLPWGTSTTNFSRVAGQSLRYHYSYRLFKRHLLSGKSAVILMQQGPAVRHYVFIYKVTVFGPHKGFLAVNFNCETLTLLPWQRVVAMLRGGCVWIFDK